LYSVGGDPKGTSISSWGDAGRFVFSGFDIFKLVIVRDNGIGIPRSFDPDTSNTLGVKIARDIVRMQLNGKIEFRCTDGTEVRIDFPVEKESAQTGAAEREPSKEARSRIKSMVVEDETITSMEIQQMVQSLGLEVAGAVVSGEEAVEQFEKSKPDIVLMDIKLDGEMNGIQAAEKIKQKTEVAVIFLSAVLGKYMQEIDKLSGAKGFLHKPFQNLELREEIERLLPASRKKAG